MIVTTQVEDEKDGYLTVEADVELVSPSRPMRRGALPEDGDPGEAAEFKVHLLTFLALDEHGTEVSRRPEEMPRAIVDRAQDAVEEIAAAREEDFEEEVW